MFCEKCGLQISEGQAFCGNCGAPAGKNSINKNILSQSQPSYGKKVFNSKKLVLFFVVAVLIIAGFVFVVNYEPQLNQEQKEQVERIIEMREEWSHVGGKEVNNLTLLYHNNEEILYFKAEYREALRYSSYAMMTYYYEENNYRVNQNGLLKLNHQRLGGQGVNIDYYSSMTNEKLRDEITKAYRRLLKSSK